MQKNILKLTMAALGCIVATTIAFGTASSASTEWRTGASHSVNNESSNADYKLTDKQVDDIYQELLIGKMNDISADETPKYRVKEPVRIIKPEVKDSGYENEGNKSLAHESVTAKAYLIENNLLERRSSLDCSSKGATITHAEDGEKVYRQVFEQKYTQYCSKNIESHEDAVQNFHNFLNAIKSKMLSNSSDFNSFVDDSDSRKITQKLNKLETAFKTDLKGITSGYKTMYLKYLKSTKKYCDMYSLDLHVCNIDSIKKTDFLMLLDKVSYGIQPSRPIAYRSSVCYRTADHYSETTPDYWNGVPREGILREYWDSKTISGDADFVGDTFYYVSSNVYELYFVDLLNRGIIFKDEFSKGGAAKNFLKYYDNDVKDSPWFQGKGVADWGSDVLGAGYSVNENVYWPTAVSFFTDEGLTKMDVYQYIEDIMRETEKDLTQTEADIISYKFGIKFLNQYSGNKLKTLKFLIAKGMLNFEDENEFYNLEDPATCEDAYIMLYRLHNSGARFDFSQVQLTDGDAYWQTKGYAEDNVPVIELPNGYLMSNGSAKLVSDEDNVADAGSFHLFGKLFATALAANSTKKQYNVTFQLSADANWKYANIPIALIEARTISHEDVKSVTKQVIKYNNKKVNVYKTVISVMASNEAGALSVAKKNLSVSTGQSNKVECITKIKGVVGNSTYTVISQSALKKSFSNISVIEDKVLLNTVTGTQAIFLPDLGYALVGNTVIRSKDLIAEQAQTGGEVYYNMSVIVSLLDNCYMEKIGYKSGIFRIPNNLNEHSGKVYNEYGDTGRKAHCVRAAVTSTMESHFGDESLQQGNSMYFYRINDVVDGTNTIIREFNVKNGSKSASMILAVDWVFAIPGTELFSDGKTANKIISSGKKLTNAQLTKYLYTRPSGADTQVLRAWWDSNYIASNALANFIYGTENVEYITSGYIVPQINILYKSNNKISKNKGEWEQALFKGFVCNSWGEKTGDSETLGNYFGGGSDWSTWFTYYYSGASCFGWLRSADKVTQDEYETLVSLANQYRTMKMSAGYYSSKYDSYVFDGEFLRTKCGIMYRNLDLCSYVNKFAVHNNQVNRIEFVTRTEGFASVAKNKTVVQVGNNTKHRMLYQGTKTLKDGQQYYVLAPIGNAAVKKTSSSLYNGGYVQYYPNPSGYLSTNNPTFILDNGTGEYSASAWKKMYRAWQHAYLGFSDFPEIITCKDAFSYSKSIAKNAKKNGVKMQWNQTFYKMKSSDSNRSAAAVATENAANNSIVLQEGYNAYTSMASSQLDKKSEKKINVSKRIGIAPEEMSQFEKAQRASLAVINGIANEQYVTFAVPVFYVPVNDYKFVEMSNIAENDKFADRLVMLIEGGNDSALRYGSYYYNAVTKSVQESIIANYVGTKKLNELGKGVQVGIAGVRFYVESTGDGKSKNVWLYSSSLNITSSRKALVRAAREWRTKAATRKAFKSEVEKILSGMTVECDGAYYPLTSYIRDKNKDGADGGIQLGNISITPASSKHGIIYQKKNTAWGFKRGTEKKITSENSTAYQYVRIRIKFDGELYVRPLDKDGKCWTLAPKTVTGNLGYGSDSLVFFEENLSYDSNQYSDLSISSNRFNLSEAFSAAKAKFQKNFKLALIGDIKSWVLMVIIIIASYLSIMSWMAYMILHYGIMRNILEALASGPGGHVNGGIDLLKIVTFGFYSLDSEPTLARVCVNLLGCTIVAAIAFNMM